MFSGHFVGHPDMVKSGHVLLRTWILCSVFGANHLVSAKVVDRRVGGRHQTAEAGGEEHGVAAEGLLALRVVLRMRSEGLRAMIASERAERASERGVGSTCARFA